jgi:hypothetical protein
MREATSIAWKGVRVALLLMQIIEIALIISREALIEVSLCSC